MNTPQERTNAANALDERLETRERQLAGIVTQLAAAVIQHQVRFGDEAETGHDRVAPYEAAAGGCGGARRKPD